MIPAPTPMTHTALIALASVLGAAAVWRRLAERAVVAYDPGAWVPVLLGVAVVGYAILIGVGTDDGLPPRPVPQLHRATPICLMLVMSTAAVALYRPMLHIGLLADDFALLDLARTLDLMPRRWEYLRPVGLASWWAVAGIGGDGDVAFRLHLLNVLLHGVNAALVGIFAVWLGRSVAVAAFASVLFLAWPIAVEPVVWCSGTFDVQLTTYALVLCLVVVKRPVLRLRDYVVCLGLGVLMLGTKETGVIAGPLALFTHWARWGYRSRGAYGVTAMLSALALAYAVVRHMAGRLDPRVMPSPDGQAVRRLFTQSFGALFVPLHDGLLNKVPLAALLVPIGLVVLVVIWLRRWQSAPEDARLALFAAGGVVLALAPTITPFGVGGNLQGSRYLYLPSAIWVVALSAAVLDGCASRRAGRWVSYGVAAVSAVVAALAVTMHFQPWHDAQRVRDLVLLKLAAVPASCVRVYVPVPDHVSGAYVFRNGLTEGATSIGRTFDFVSEDQADEECRVH